MLQGERISCIQTPQEKIYSAIVRERAKKIHAYNKSLSLPLPLKSQMAHPL